MEYEITEVNLTKEGYTLTLMPKTDYDILREIKEFLDEEVQDEGSN